MPKTLSAEQKLQRSAEHDLKGLQLKADAKKAKVIASLNDPTVLEAVYDMVVSMEGRAAAPSIEGPKATKQMEMVWMDQYNRVEITPAKFLRVVLQKLDKVCFSDGNLKSLMKKGAREVDKRVLAMYIEYTTDIPAGWTLPRSLRDLDAFVTYAQKNFKKNRIEGLLLPAEWDDIQSPYGIYGIDDLREIGEGVIVFLKEKPESRVHMKKTFTGALALANNYSKFEAILREEDGTVFEKLYGLFPEEKNDDEDDESDEKKKKKNFAESYVASQTALPEVGLDMLPQTPPVGVTSKLDSSLTKDSRHFRLKRVVPQEGVPEKVLPGDQAAGGAQHEGPLDGDDDLLSKKPRKTFPLFGASGSSAGSQALQ